MYSFIDYCHSLVSLERERATGTGRVGSLHAVPYHTVQYSPLYAGGAGIRFLREFACTLLLSLHVIINVYILYSRCCGKRMERRLDANPPPRPLARPACAKQQGALERFEFLEPSTPVPAWTRRTISIVTSRVRPVPAWTRIDKVPRTTHGDRLVRRRADAQGGGFRDRGGQSRITGDSCLFRRSKPRRTIVATAEHDDVNNLKIPTHIPHTPGAA